MRKFINIISEAPLSGYEFFGDWGNDAHEPKAVIDGSYNPTPKEAERLTNNGNSFMSRIDRALVRKPETEKALRKAFARFDQPIYLFMVNGEAGIRMAIDYLDYGELSRKGKNDHIWSNLGSEIRKRVDEVHALDPKAAIVILTHNEGGSMRHPLTPWMIVHRMAHAMAVLINPSNYHTALWDIARAYSGKHEPDQYDMDAAMKEICTFRAARENNVLDDQLGEYNCEIFSQFVMTGRAKFRLPPILRKASNGPTALTTDPQLLANAQEACETIEKLINEKLGRFVADTQGKIFVC